MNKIPVGVSQCLLGEPVRFDGGHKHFRYLTGVLSEYMEFQPVCPEVAIGLGIPRKPIRLLATDRGTRVVGTTNPDLDVTEQLAAEADIAATAMPDICGYVFMQNSPSCGVYGLKRYGANGHPLDNKGRGAYAQRLMELMPLLPVEEAGRLNDPGLRENFITRVFAYRDWQQNAGPQPTPKQLVDFYSRYKYQVMAHSIPAYNAIGRLLSDLRGKDMTSVGAEFITLFMEGLSRPAGRKGNVNALMHLRGYLKDLLDRDEKEELGQLIETYRLGEVPLVVPLTLLKHYLKKVNIPYLQQQSYWSPYPEKLGLRNVCID